MVYRATPTDLAVGRTVNRLLAAFTILVAATTLILLVVVASAAVGAVA